MEITQEQVKEKVIDYIKQTSSFTGIGSGFNATQELMLQSKETYAHVVNIGTSILCTKWEVGPAGGSFVQSICNNDLMGSFGRADHINQEFIGFYVKMLYNVGM